MGKQDDSPNDIIHLQSRLEKRGWVATGELFIFSYMIVLMMMMMMSYPSLCCSCYGRVSSLNGEPEPGVLVEAVSVSGLVQYQEESKTEQDGTYRIRGLSVSNPLTYYFFKRCRTCLLASKGGEARGELHPY